MVFIFYRSVPLSILHLVACVLHNTNEGANKIKPQECVTNERNNRSGSTDLQEVLGSTNWGLRIISLPSLSCVENIRGSANWLFYGYWR